MGRIKMFLKLLGLSAIFLSLAALGMGVRMLLKKGSGFPETHISRNKEMRKRGIKCAQETDIGCSPSDDFPGCATCGRIHV